MTARHRALVGLLLTAGLAGCTSPEAARTAGAGARSGADPGNWGQVAQMHEGSRPYWETPRLIEPFGYAEATPTRQAQRLSPEDTPRRR